MADSKSFFDSTSWVAQYAWFGEFPPLFFPSINLFLMTSRGDAGAMHDMQNVNTDNQLMASSGSPNSLGYQFLN